MKISTGLPSVLCSSCSALMQIFVGRFVWCFAYISLKLFFFLMSSMIREDLCNNHTVFGLERDKLGRKNVVDKGYFH